MQQCIAILLYVWLIFLYISSMDLRGYLRPFLTNVGQWFSHFVHLRGLTARAELILNCSPTTTAGFMSDMQN